MGCSTLELDADAAHVDVRDWALDDPDGQDLDDIREIRDEIEDRVQALFDEIETEGSANITGRKPAGAESEA
jgi:protein-tyrosine-phosphatase